MANSANAAQSLYDDADEVRRHVQKGHHRAVIGGLWEELGELQLGFLKRHGLRPPHTIIDVGAGSFRAGVKIIPYVEPGNYYALDSQDSLLEAGYTRQIERAGLAARFPRKNFTANADFDVSGFGQMFDVGIAQSVFTHMPIARLSACLASLAPFFRVHGRFFATVFLVGQPQAKGTVRHVPGGIVTSPNRDPFHTTIPALREIASLTHDWRMDLIGNWDHPRNQQMVAFVREG